MDSVIWEQHPVLRDPAAVIAFEGWGDAGESSSAAVRHLVDTFDSERVATIDADEFFDFQVRRPVILLDEDEIREIAWPETEIWMVSPPWSYRDLIVVTGPEPHARWKRFSNDLIEVLRSLGVRKAVTLGAFVGQVPHTLPVPLMGSGADRDTLARHSLFASDYEGPTGIVGVLTSALSGAGIDTVVSPRAITVSKILKHVRSGRIRSVHSLSEDFGEVIEAEALETSSLVGVPIREAHLPDGVIVGAIVRGNEVIIPSGDTVTRPNDLVVIFARSEAVKKVEKLFAVKLEFF